MVVFFVFSSHKGAHLELTGRVLKSRTGALDETHSIAVLDFRIANPSDIPFIVRDVKLTLEKAGGEKADGQLVSRMDIGQVFQFNKFLGLQFNDTLGIKDKVPAHGQIDRMVAASFEVPEKDLENAKDLVLWIQDMDGAEFETVHKLK